jgi:DNA-binding NarL/FixJ family response regulator
MAARVLIVDDHPSFRAAARQLLEIEGFDVVGEAADGSSGIEAARALRPDLILLDVQLPDIDGFEVAERITSEHGDDGPAVILVSSRDWTDYARTCACPFVAKAELSGEKIAASLS